MNELSLFSGAGGSLLATKHLLKWRTVGYVEFNKYCQQVLAQRIKEEFLDEAPIFGDIDGFIESGAVKKYKGYIDVLTAGFPCQPFSVAGKRRLDDPRNKWPQTIQCIRDVRPRRAFLENVPGLLNSGYFGEILTSLAEAGFDARWIVLGADDVGAPHRRKRLWILADSNNTGQRSSARRGQSSREQARDDARRRGSEVADSNAGHIQPNQTIRTGGIAADDGSQFMADSYSDDGWTGSGTVAQGRGSRLEHRSGSAGQSIGRSREDVADTNSERGCLWETGGKDAKDVGESSRSEETFGWWDTEPDVGRVAHGVSKRVDRLKSLGNSLVPQIPFLIGSCIKEIEGI